MRNPFTKTTTDDDGAATVDAAYDAIQRAKAKIDKISGERTRLGHSTSENAAKLPRLSLDESESGKLAYSKVAGDVEAAEKKLRVLDHQLAGARDELREAERAFDLAGLDKRTAMFKRLTNQKTKLATELSDTLATSVRLTNKLHELNAKIVAAYPGGIPPAGAGLSVQEVKQSIARELWRLSPNDPLQPGSAPAFPGAHIDLIAGTDTRKMKSLVDVVTEANEYLLRKVEQGPAPVKPKSSPALVSPGPAPSSADAVASGTTASATNPPTQTADEIMATIPKRRLS